MKNGTCDVTEHLWRFAARPKDRMLVAHLASCAPCWREWKLVIGRKPAPGHSSGETHVRDQTLEAFAQGLLELETAEHVEAHCSRCWLCWHNRLRVAERQRLPALGELLHR